MDTLTTQRQQIENILGEYAKIPYAHGKIEIQTIFDPMHRQAESGSQKRRS